MQCLEDLAKFPAANPTLKVLLFSIDLVLLKTSALK